MDPYYYYFLTSASYVVAIKDLYSKCKTPDWHVSSVGRHAASTLVVGVVSFLIGYDGRMQLNINQTCGLLIKEMSHAESEGSFTSAMFIHVSSWAQRSVPKRGEMEQNFPDWLVSKHWMSSSDFKVMALCFGCSHVPPTPSPRMGKNYQHLSFLQHKKNIVSYLLTMEERMLSPPSRLTHSEWFKSHMP